MNLLKGYLGSKIYQPPFVISFSVNSKFSNLVETGTALQNRLIKLILKFKDFIPYVAYKFLPLIKKYKKNFIISEELHTKILEFLGRDLNTRLEDLSGFDKREYKRCQKLFSKKYEKPHSCNLPWVPDSFIAKTRLIDFQEAIDYFKSLYIAEGQKSQL